MSAGPYAVPSEEGGVDYRVVYEYQSALRLYRWHVGSAEEAFKFAADAERELIPSIRDSIRVEMRTLSPWEDITP